ncbi:MAG: hypothetical protein V1695_03155 [Candidatus Uhrbacteria bacterium]
MGGINVRSVYFYVLCSLDIGVPIKEPNPSIQAIVEQHLKKVDFSTAFSNSHSHAQNNMASLLTILKRGGLYRLGRKALCSEFDFEQGTLGCRWMDNVPALELFPNHSSAVTSTLERNPDARIGDVLGQVASAQVIRGVLTELMMQIAQEQDRSMRESDERSRHVLMTSHRSVAGLAMLNLMTPMPGRGDIVVYEFRTFPDGRTSLQSSHVLPYPTDA